MVASAPLLSSALEARLRENSTNSHKPPSTDPPWAARPKREKPKGRKRGAQPGHPGAHRPLLPVGEVDFVIAVEPGHCSRRSCRSALRASERDAPPLRHQVTELPLVKPVVTEYQLHARKCSQCGEITRAELPAGVTARSFGPRLQAVTSLLSGRFRLSRRETEEAVAALFGAEISLGSISALEGATSDALKSSYEEALLSVRHAKILNVDETGWKEGRARAWLWIAVTPVLAVFWLDPRRNRAAFKRFLGNFTGHLVTDRWGAYMSHNQARHQLCWAHLLRDFEKLLLVRGEGASLGKKALVEVHLLFTHWHRFERGEISREQLRRELAPLKTRLYDLLIEGLQNSNAKASGLCAKLVPHWKSLWVFVDVEGVTPTNNDAERPLRSAVLWRKGSFGSQSRGGSEFAERMLTVTATLRKQKRNVLEFLVEAIQAHDNGTKPPSLLPPEPKKRSPR